MSEGPANPENDQAISPHAMFEFAVETYETMTNLVNRSEPDTQKSQEHLGVWMRNVISSAHKVLKDPLGPADPSFVDVVNYIKAAKPEFYAIYRHEIEEAIREIEEKRRKAQQRAEEEE